MIDIDEGTLALTSSDVVSYLVGPEGFGLVHDMALQACVGGTSRILSGADRQNQLYEDQVIGQLGVYAFSMVKFGSPARYLESRRKANANPTKGDGGKDYEHLDLDVKTSLMRGRSQNPLDYTMLVRPAERHPNWTYVLGLVRRPWDHPPIQVLMVGWCLTSDLRPPDASANAEESRYTRPANLLRPMSTLHVRP